MTNLVQSDPAAYQEHIDKLLAQAGAQGSSGTGGQVGGSAEHGAAARRPGRSRRWGHQASHQWIASRHAAGAQSFAAARALLDTLIGRQQSSANGGGRP